MKTRSKVIFLVLLCAFVGASVFLSFNALSRDTYEFEQQNDVGGTGKSGYVFASFSGNSSTKKVRVYHPMIPGSGAQKGKFIEDTSQTVIGIDAFTFVSDENMEYCYIGPDVAYIDEKAFFGCFALRAIIVDDANPYYTDVDGVLYTADMSKIMLYPTYHTSYLQEIGKLPQGYFDDGSNAEEYAIPEGVTRVSSGCFYKIWGIKRITLPSTLKEIGEMAFFRCESLLLAELPDGLKLIENDAFSYCKSMKYAVYIPQSVEEIRSFAFYECAGLKRFYLGANTSEDIKLGSRWQSKGINDLSYDDPVFGSTRDEVNAYNEQMRTENESQTGEVQVNG